jgi:hypothetical protein
LTGPRRPHQANAGRGGARHGTAATAEKDWPMHTRGTYGALTILLGILSGQAGHWLITPHADASTTRTVLVVIQLMVSLSFFFWAIWKVWQAGRAGRAAD